MPKRGSQLVREQNYKWLVATYGERCIRCGAPPEKDGKLQIDEISSRPEDFDNPGNLSLVCPHCNSQLRDIDALDERRPEQHRAIIEAARLKRLQEIARAREAERRPPPKSEEARLIKAYKKAVRLSGAAVPIPDDAINKYVLDYFGGSSEMKAKAAFYKPFAMLVVRIILKQGGPVGEKRILNLGSRKIPGNPSQTTLKRYLDEFCEPDPFDENHQLFIRLDDGGEWKIYLKQPGRARGQQEEGA
jgi:hypothetical protein